MKGNLSSNCDDSSLNKLITHTNCDSLGPKMDGDVSNTSPVSASLRTSVPPLSESGKSCYRAVLRGQCRDDTTRKSVPGGPC